MNGGQVMAKRQRNIALKQYYSDPNICKNCNKVIKVSNTEKVSQARRKKFCNRSCAAIYNNRNHPKRKATLEKFGICEGCGCDIFYKKRKDKSGFNVRRFCNACLRRVRVQSRWGNHHKFIGDRTLRELYSDRKNYTSARASIRRHAYNTYMAFGKEFKCLKCGYDLYVEVCHIKNVSDFPLDTKIKIVNDPSNLIGLCPNHHWEFDNDILSIDDIVFIAASSRGQARQPHKLEV